MDLESLAGLRDPNRVISIMLDNQLTMMMAGAQTEATVAIRDFVTDNYFSPQDLPKNSPSGPYRLKLLGGENRLTIEIQSEQNLVLDRAPMGLAPFRRLARDYRVLCTRYEEAVGAMHSNQAETVDMARRGLHDEAAELLRQSLSGKIDIDHRTARRFFTLLYALYIGSSGLR